MYSLLVFGSSNITTSVNFGLEIGKIENFLKQSAIDIYLTKDINILNKGSNRIALKPALRNGTGSSERIKNIKDEK